MGIEEYMLRHHIMEYLPLLFEDVHHAILKQSLFYCYGIDMKYYYNSRREIILESHGGHLQT